MSTLRYALLPIVNAMLLVVVLSSPPAFLAGVPSAAEDEKLLETGSSSKVKSKTETANEIKIVTYNIRWRGGEDLKRLISLFKDDKEIGGAAILGLQEVDRQKKRTQNVNATRLMAEDLGMHYVWAAPPPAAGKAFEEEETGVAILSSYPMTDVRRIVLPHEGPGGRRRVAVGATVELGPGESIRVYSIHAETRISNKKRLEQFEAVLDDLRSHHAGVRRSVVLGDFNTLTGKDVNATSQLFKEEGFHTPFPNELSTWRTFILELKLDWLWLRGLDVRGYGIDKNIGLSDHWPLWAVVSMK